MVFALPKLRPSGPAGYEPRTEKPAADSGFVLRSQIANRLSGNLTLIAEHPLEPPAGPRFPRPLPPRFPPAGPSKALCRKSQRNPP